VKLITYGVDKYHRVLAFVFVNDMNVNLEIVKAGLAEVYQGKDAIKVYQKELEEARAAKLGMWSQREKYESPADFRKRMRIWGN